MTLSPTKEKEIGKRGETKEGRKPISPLIWVTDFTYLRFQNTGTAPNIIHSDQGVEYTNREYLKLMTDLGINISMSQKASPWQNGYQESFCHNLKTDLGLEFDRFNSIGEFVEAIHQTINYYNHQRIHTSLKMAPVQFRQQYLQRLTPVEKVV